jgi:hypothetical protein
LRRPDIQFGRLSPLTIKTFIPLAVPGEPVPLLLEVSDVNASAQAAAFAVSFGELCRLIRVETIVGVAFASPTKRRPESAGSSSR